MSKKLIIFVVAFALALIAFVVWWFTQAPPTTTPQPTNEEINTDVTPTELQPWQTPTQPTPLTPEKKAETDAKNTALRFVEIYGSYSTDAPYQNLMAADYMFSDSFKQVISGQKTTTEPGGGFYSVTTRALSAQVESQSDSQARILVSTQREELFNSIGETQLRYQDIRVTLVKSGSNWLINGAEWQ